MIPCLVPSMPSLCASIPARCSKWLCWGCDHRSAIAPRCGLLCCTAQRKDWPGCPLVLSLIAIHEGTSCSGGSLFRSEADSSTTPDLGFFDGATLFLLLANKDQTQFQQVVCCVYIFRWDGSWGLDLMQPLLFPSWAIVLYIYWVAP